MCTCSNVKKTLSEFGLLFSVKFLWHMLIIQGTQVSFGSILYINVDILHTHLFAFFPHPSLPPLLPAFLTSYDVPYLTLHLLKWHLIVGGLQAVWKVCGILLSRMHVDRPLCWEKFWITHSNTFSESSNKGHSKWAILSWQACRIHNNCPQRAYLLKMHRNVFNYGFIGSYSYIHRLFCFISWSSPAVYHCIPC